MKHKGENSLAKKVFWGMVIFSAILLAWIALTVKDSYTYNKAKSSRTFSEGWYVFDELGNRKNITLPTKEGVDENGEYVLYGTVPKDVEDGEVIVFWVTYADVICYVDGEVRAIYNDKDVRPFGKHSLCGYMNIPVNKSDAGAAIKMVYDSTYYFAQGYFGEAFIGSEVGVKDRIVSMKLPIFMAAIIMVFISAIIIVANFLIKSMGFKMSTVSMGYLGIAMLMYSTDPLYLSGATRYFWGNTFFWYMLYRCCSVLLSIPILLFFDSLQKGRHHATYRFGLFVNYLVCGLCVAFQVSGIMDLPVSVDIKNVGIAMTLLIVLITSIQEYKAGIKDSIKLILVPVVMITLSFMVTVIREMFFEELNTYSIMYPTVILAFMVVAYAAIKELLRQTQQAIWASRAKTEFLARMSHEIRTPINAVLGMDEMILRESREKSTLEYAGNIKRAGQTLLTLISDILDLSKIETGKMDIVPVKYSINAFVDKLVTIISPQMEKKGLAFDIRVNPKMPSVLCGDEVRLSQIVMNLLSNAYKYTNYGSVTLNIDFKENPKADIITLKVMVEDTGIGIRESDIKQLFEEFKRADIQHNNNIEGSGLGLAISSKLLLQMNSELKVDSTYGYGSKFYFEIAQEVVDHIPVGEYSYGNNESLSGGNYKERFVAPDKSLLVVDDTQVNLLVFAGLLKQTQIQIDTALSGEEALELLKKKKYDIIFMDHLMPGMDGVETLNRIRKLEAGSKKQTPVIALTANALSGSREWYLENGFSDYLSKPIEADELEKMIEGYL